MDLTYIYDRIKYHKTTEETLERARILTEESIKNLDEAFGQKNSFSTLKDLARNLAHRAY